MNIENIALNAAKKLNTNDKSKDLDVLAMEKKKDTLKKEISELVNKDKAISTGEGFRVKTKDGKNPLEEQILKKEEEIRSLENEIVLLPKRKMAAELKNEIKMLEKKHKERITGGAGFRDLDSQEDPLEKEILEKEEKLRALENEISSYGKKKEAAPKGKDPAVDPGEKAAAAGGHVEDDFKYAGANEGFGEKGDYERLTETGTEGIQPILDSEYIPADSKIDRLTEVGTEGTEPILDSESFPAETKIDRLTEVGTEGTEPILDSENIPVEKKEMGEESFGSEGENIEGLLEGRNRKEMGTLESRIAELKRDMEDARKEYLQKDYEKNTAWKRLKKFFAGPEKHAQDLDHYEEDADLAAYRGYYDNKRFDLQKLMIQQAKENGATNEQLADLVLEFRTEQKITMADEHDNVKIEAQEGTMKGAIFGNIKKMADDYRKLPLKTKLAIGVGFMVGGSLLAGTGAAAAGVVGGVAVTRRVIMGMFSGIGLSSTLENRGKIKDRSRAEDEKAAFLKAMEGMSEEQKYDLLMKNLNDSVMDRENSIDKIKNQDIRQLAAGAAWVTFVGSGMFGSLLSKGYHGVIDHFSGAGHHVDIPTPQLHGHVEDLNINSGSNFSATLAKELHNPNSDVYKFHPEFKGHNPQEIIDKVLADFKATHPEMHGHDPDYVLANAKIHFNPQTLHAEMDEGQYGWYDTVETPDTDNVPVPGHDIPTPPVPDPDTTININITPTPEAVHPMDTLPPTQEFVAAPPMHDMVQPPMPTEFIDNHPPMPVGGLHHEIFLGGHINLERLGAMNHGEALKTVRGHIFNNNIDKFRELRHVPVLNHDGSLNREALDRVRLPQRTHGFINRLATGQNHEIRPRGGENFDGWTRRIVGAAANHHQAGGGMHQAGGGMSHGAAGGHRR